MKKTLCDAWRVSRSATTIFEIYQYFILTAINLNKKPSEFTGVQFIDISESQAGQRLDNFLFKTLKKLPRSRIYKIIRKGEVRINKKRIKPEYKLRAGDQLRLPPLWLSQDDETPLQIPHSLVEELESAILFENEDMLIINKPSGVAVHSGSGVRFGVIDVFRQLRHQTDIELVHRLDRDTSGCLMLAKQRQALLDLQRQLQSNAIRKTYLAIVKGYWDMDLHSVEYPLKRQSMPNGERRVFVDDNGQRAITRVNRIRHFSREDVDYSLLSIQLLTGRTHQIRVHCQAAGHEIAGDQKYGDRRFNQQMKKLGSKRLLLHASELEISANAHTKSVKIFAPEPHEFRSLGHKTR